MTIREVATLPAASLNLGLSLAPGLVAAGTAKLTSDIAELALAVAAQAQLVTDFPPTPDYLAKAALEFTSSLSPESLAARLNPATWIDLNATVNARLVAELALIEAQLIIAEGIFAKFQAGLDSGGLFGWTYAGSVRGMGQQLELQTRAGLRDVPPETQVNALILATAEFSTWGSFSAGFGTGQSSAKDLGAKPSTDTLVFQGFLGGAQWNTGLAQLSREFELILLDLEGSKAAIEAQIQVSLGVNLPLPQALIDAAIDIDIEAALGTLTAVIDLTATISAIKAKIEALIDLSAQIGELAPSAGGITLWSYSGPLGDLGSEFAPEVADGLPGVGDPEGSAYGLVIACDSPSAWTDFGLIFKTE